MVNREILTAASALVCERPSAETTDDYAERAPYILAAFCSLAAALDMRYRKAHSMSTVKHSVRATLPLDEEFPLVEELIVAATYYLAAMLVIDENETLSDKLFDLYTDAVATLAASLPTQKEQIVNKY